MKRAIFFILLVVGLLSALATLPMDLARANSWAVGNLVGLCAGTEIRTGSGVNYPIHTIVPLDNWTVKVIGGPRQIGGETWWDISRKEAGDPSGGSGWVIQSQADNCPTDGGGDDGGGGDNSDPHEHRDGLLSTDPDGPNPIWGAIPNVAEYFTWPVIHVADSDYYAGYLQFMDVLGYCPKDGLTHLHPGADIATITLREKEAVLSDVKAVNYEDLPPVYAVAEGKVIAIDYRTGGYGINILILHVVHEPSTGRERAIFSLYGHLHPSSVRVSLNQTVHPGDWIARVDHSGNFGGHGHLHFELRKSKDLPKAYCALTKADIQKEFFDPIAYIRDHYQAPGTQAQRARDIVAISVGDTGSVIAAQSATINPNQTKTGFQFDIIGMLQRAIFGIVFPGSELEVSIYQPDGSLYAVEKGTSSFQFQIDDPMPGTWTYSVRAISVPHNDYPFDVAIATSNEALIDTGEVEDGIVDFPSEDLIDPTTLLKVSPGQPDGNNGWYRQPVQLELSSSDNSGREILTLFSFDGGANFIRYTTPITLSTEGVNSLAYYSVDSAGNTEEMHYFEIKIDTRPPVVNVWTDQPDYTRVQPYIVHFNAYDPEPGSGIWALSGLFNQQAVVDGQSIDLFWYDLGHYTLSAEAEDYAGWITNNAASFELIATIESLQATVERLCSENYIKSPGTCQSLQAKLGAALDLRDRNQMNAMLGQLYAFQNEINAQTGKHIKPEAARILLMDSTYVIVLAGGRVTTPTSTPTSLPPVSDTTGLTLVEAGNPNVQSIGVWHSHETSAASGGAYLYNGGANTDALSLKVTGDRVGVLYVQHPALNSLTIEVDGTNRQTLSTQGQEAFGQITVISGLGAGEHTVRIFSADGVIGVDGFFVEGLVQSPTETSVPTETPAPVTETPITVPSSTPSVPASPTSTPAPAHLPIMETMDDGAPRWLSSGDWVLVASEFGRSWYVESTDQVSQLLYTSQIDLRGTSYPRLSFQSQLSNTYSSALVEVSVDGLNWMVISTVTPSGSLTEQSVDLSAFRGQIINLRFTWLSQPGKKHKDKKADSWSLDLISIQETTPTVAPVTVTPTSAPATATTTQLPPRATLEPPTVTPTNVPPIATPEPPTSVPPTATPTDLPPTVTPEPPTVTPEVPIK